MAIIERANGAESRSAIADGPRTPALVIDTATVERNYRRIQSALPEGTVIRYATKCNSDQIVLKSLSRLGCSFEAASATEIEILSSVGVKPAEVIHTLPFRSERDVLQSQRLGVGRWTVDSRSEIDKLARLAPGASICIRLAVDDESSHWRLSRKFGATPQSAVELMNVASGEGLSVDGMSFHVGSQVIDVKAWANAILLAGSVLDSADDEWRPSVLNIGGGFPVPYTESVPEVEQIGRHIEEAAGRLGHELALEAEPGRFLVAEAGTVTTEVTGVSERHGRRWVFLDIGAFNGLFEASPGGGGLQFRVTAVGVSEEDHVTPSVLAGPSCDGDDTVGEDVLLPAGLAAGDRLQIHNAGAYSTAYVTSLCGVDPVDVSVLNQRLDDEPVRVDGVDIYRVAWPGSELFERAKSLEEQWFELSDFVEDDGLAGYEPYDSASTFVVVESADGDLLSVCRLISSSARGFKTINDFELSDEGLASFRCVPDSEVIEMGTIATHPAARGLGPTLDVMRGVLDTAQRRHVRWVLASIDAGLREVYVGAPLFMPCHPIGESREYFGSVTVPVFGSLDEHAESLRRRSPDVYEFFYGGSPVRPAL